MLDPSLCAALSVLGQTHGKEHTLSRGFTWPPPPKRVLAKKTPKLVDQVFIVWLSQVYALEISLPYFCSICYYGVRANFGTFMLEYDQSKKQGKAYKEEIHWFGAGIVVVVLQFQA